MRASRHSARSRHHQDCNAAGNQVDLATVVEMSRKSITGHPASFPDRNDLEYSAGCLESICDIITAPKCVIRKPVGIVLVACGSVLPATAFNGWATGWQSVYRR
jgi:hypothetical protein